MSIKAMTWAFSLTGLRPAQKLILLAFADYADDEGVCYPAYATIARKSECSRRTVMRAVADFKTQGLIARVSQRRNGQGDSDTNIYHFDLSKTSVSTAGSSSTGSDRKSPPSDIAVTLPVVTQLCHRGGDTAVSPKPSLNRQLEPKDSLSEAAVASSTAVAVITPVAARHPLAVVQTPSGSKWGEPIDLELAQLIYRDINALTPIKAPVWADWANCLRLMREQDQRLPAHIAALWRWAHSDPFWRSNILSPAKLREKWAQLAIKCNQEKGRTPHANGHPSGHKSTPADAVYDDAADLVAQLESEAQGG